MKLLSVLCLVFALSACTAGRIALSGAQAALEPLQFYLVGDDGAPAKFEGTWGANARFFAGYGLANMTIRAGVLQEDGSMLDFWSYELKEYSGPLAFELVFSAVESDPWAQIIPTTYERARQSLKLLPPLPEAAMGPAALASAPQPSGKIRLP